MATPPDMSTPVTRAELREELAKYPTKEELRQELRQELAKYPTKDELREELAKYPTKEELRQELAKHPTKEELRDGLSGLEARLDAKLELWAGALFERVRTELRATLRAELGAELARHVKSFEEFTRSMIIAMNEPYRDLPARVTRLEAKVFAPKRKRR